VSQVTRETGTLATMWTNASRPIHARVETRAPTQWAVSRVHVLPRVTLCYQTDSARVLQEVMQIYSYHSSVLTAFIEMKSYPVLSLTSKGSLLLL